MKRVAILLSVLLAALPCFVQAQTTISSGQEEGKKKMVGQATTTTTITEQTRVSLKLEEGDHITLRNRFGPIIVTGIGGDALEASVALVRQGASNYKFRVVTSRGKERIMVATAVSIPDLMPREKEGKAVGTGQGSSSSGTMTPRPRTPQPASPPEVRPVPPTRPATPAQRAEQDAARARERAPRADLSESSPPEYLRGVSDIKLEVKLPRNAHVDLIDTRRYAVNTNGNSPSYLTNTRNDVTVANMDTPISIVSSGEVQVTKVAGLEAKTRAGNISVKDVSGPVSISTVTGAVLIKDADGDVRAVSISGAISVDCAKGRTEAGTTNGTITLMGIGGDLDATTTGGNITFTGAIREAGRYRLKSITGIVRMFIQKEPPGFVANLSSYKGQILSDFDLKRELSANTATSDLARAQDQIVRRMTGRYGEGNTRITLDSFSGTVQLARAPSEVWKKCK
ncbi:MAG: hypothetical protein ICV60_16910 [Pyrinomonadaceae bacterium]|nr:hypothetical protein [Pyrinomonadaceae bacterium]